MKIVINACYGGFGLSEAGMQEYARRKGVTLYPEKKTVHTVYWTVPPEDRPREIGDWSETTKEERVAYNQAYSRCTIYDREFERNDPHLVATVEALGEKANGMCAKLEVVEIPDDVEWEIQEYDGNEHVAERHRTWP